MNYRGLEVVGGASVLIFFLTMAPFVILVIIGIPKGEVVADVSIMSTVISI